MDADHIERAILSIAIDTDGDISDDDGTDVARRVAAGAVESALQLAARQSGSDLPFDREFLAAIRPELEQRLIVARLERGSLTVAIEVATPTVLWLIQQLWPGLADSVIQSLAEGTFRRLHRGRGTVQSVLNLVQLRHPHNARLFRVSLEYEDGYMATWEDRSARTAPKLTTQSIRIRYTSRSKRKGRRGKTKG